MTSGAAGHDLDSVDWDTDDEVEIFGHSSFPASGSIECNGEASSSAGDLVHQFVSMGFPKDMVLKAIEDNGKDSERSAILETLLTYSMLEEYPKEEMPGCKSPPKDAQSPDKSPDQQLDINYDLSSSDYDESFLCDLSDADSGPDNELGETSNCLSEKDGRVRSLVKMGYSADEVHTALERCGPDASVDLLTDFIGAHQLASNQDLYLPDEVKVKPLGGGGHLKKRKFSELSDRKKLGRAPEEKPMHLPHPMVGFGLPSGPRITERKLPQESLGPPYFYYENVALTPKGVWQTISQNLYGIEPEFVDSQHFCVAARKRGYIHNLPIDNRFPLLPLPPLTIFEAFPLVKRWWPSWDRRTKLNCLLTVYASARTPERIRKAVENCDGEPSLGVQNYVLTECKKWNLLWVGKNKVAPLDPDEVEKILGFPRNHTRGGGTTSQDRYKCLGNSFQVDTVAYQLSALKPLFPRGMTVLSLFSGIGGAEVALHRLGIRLKNVVSVEKSETSRTILRCWWEETNQSGNLIEYDDVEHLTSSKLEELTNRLGGFDLVIGGSPCTNLAGGNRVTRDGLEGKESSLFFEYVRILTCVKDLMGQLQH